MADRKNSKSRSSSVPPVNVVNGGGGPYCYKYPRPAVTVDTVLFKIEQETIEVLLIKRGNDPFKGCWAFPGGFVDQNEALEAAARRELEEETGLKNIKLDQIGAYGDPGRDPRGHTVSVAFCAILEQPAIVRAGDDASEARWLRALHPPRLAFDHARILAAALKHMFGASSPVPAGGGSGFRYKL
jgi:8-oxo-dGTP diphosphatase